MFQISEVNTEVLLRISIFCDVTAWSLKCIFDVSKHTVPSSCLRSCHWRWYFEMSGSARPTTPYHITECFNLYVCWSKSRV